MKDSLEFLDKLVDGKEDELNKLKRLRMIGKELKELSKINVYVEFPGMGNLVMYYKDTRVEIPLGNRSLGDIANYIGDFFINANHVNVYIRNLDIRGTLGDGVGLMLKNAFKNVDVFPLRESRG